MKYLERKGKHLALVAVLACILSGLYAIWNAAYASPHRLDHKAPRTKEWVYEEEVQTFSNHRVVNGNERRMPTKVGVTCTDPVRLELVVPLYKYPWEGVMSYIPEPNREDEYYLSWFEAGDNFGGFEQPEMFIRLRDHDDPTKPFTGSACWAFWWYDLPIHEKQETDTYPPGCTAAWSEDCS